MRAVQFSCLEEALAALRLGTVRFRCCVCGGNHLSTSKTAQKCAEKMWRGLGGTVVRRPEEAEQPSVRIASVLLVFAPWLSMPWRPPAFVKMTPAEDVWAAVVASLGFAGEHRQAKQVLAEFLKPAVATWREEAARELREQEERYRKAVAWFSEAARDVHAWFEFAAHTSTTGGRTVISRVDVVPRRQDLPDGVGVRRVIGYEWAYWASVQCNNPHSSQYLAGFRYGYRLLELDVVDVHTGAVDTLKVPFQT